MNRLWMLLLLVATLTKVSVAQTEMQVMLTRASAGPFAASALAYYNNPMNYFSLVLTPVDGRAHDIFLEMTLESDATPTKIWTENKWVGTMPKINIPSVGKKIGNTEFIQHFYRRLNTNLSESFRGVSDLLLPEGTYHLCIKVHDYFDTAKVMGSSCMNFEICYSGTSPELTAPQLRASTTGGYGLLIPTKKTNFSWTGVVSNCFEPNAFNYILKFVEVYPSQNVQEAIDLNPVKAALNCNKRTFYTFDYETNPYLKLDSGHVYVIQVQATPTDPNRAANLTNDGKSAYMTFVWCGPNKHGVVRDVEEYKERTTYMGGGSNGDGEAMTGIKEKSNQEAVANAIVGAKITMPEHSSVLNNTDGALRVIAMPVQSDSVTKVNYTVRLYEFLGDTAVTKSHQPLKTKVLKNVKGGLSMPIEMEHDWSADLERGKQYMVTVESEAEYKYNITYHVKNITYLDNYPEIDRHDSIVVFKDTKTLEDYSVFQWGEDRMQKQSAGGNMMYPSGEAEVEREGFKMTWSSATGVGEAGSVDYELQLKDGDQVVYEKKGIKGTSYMDDSLMAVLSTGKSYEVEVKTRVDGAPREGENSRSTFTMKESTRLSDKSEEMVSCSGSVTLSTEVSTPTIKQLVSNKTKVKIGGFDMVMTKAMFDEAMQTYSGTGVVEWRPAGKLVKVVVKFEGIVLNRNNEVIRGCAKATTSKMGYVKIDMGSKYEDNKVQAYAPSMANLGTSVDVRRWYDREGRNVPLMGAAELQTLPLQLPGSVFGGSEKTMTATINDMYFSAGSAVMNLLVVMRSPEDNVYLPMMATNLCMVPDRLFKDDQVIAELPKEYAVQQNDGYEIRFKPQTKAVFVGEKYANMEVAASFDLTGLGLVGVNGEKAVAEMIQTAVSVTDWTDWTAELRMGAFRVGGGGMVINPQSNVVYDHSTRQTPSQVVFPQNYKVAGRDGWKGFYIKNYKVEIPTIGAIYADLNGKSGSELAMSGENAIIDGKGLTMQGSTEVKAAARKRTTEEWSLSVESAKVKVRESIVEEAVVKGQVGVPMIAEELPYECNLLSAQSQLKLLATEATLKSTMMQGRMKMDRSSHVAVSDAKGQNAKVECNINGQLNIDFEKMGMNVDFSNVRVEGMKISNYRKSDANDVLHFDNYDFRMGTWSKASPQKFVGGNASTEYGSCGVKGDGLYFSVEEITPFVESESDNGDGHRQIGISFAGSVRLGIGGKDANGNPRTITASSTFKVGQMFNGSSKEMKDGLDSIELNTQMDMFTLKGKLGRGKDGAWYGPLQVTMLDGITVPMQAGFGEATDATGKPYDWWYLVGSEEYTEDVKMGALLVSGFGGMFACNMQLKDGKLLQKSAVDLVKGAANKAKFEPSKGSWVAKGGLLTELRDANTMNNEGFVTLAVENGHFSRVLIDMNSYIITNYLNRGVVDIEKNNRNTLIQSRAIMNYEFDGDERALRFGSMGSDVQLQYAGESMDATPDSLNAASANVNIYGESTVASAMSMMPVEFETVTWKNGKAHDWRLAIGSSDQNTPIELGKEYSTHQLVTGSGLEHDSYALAADAQEALGVSIEPNPLTDAEKMYKAGKFANTEGFAVNTMVKSHKDHKEFLSVDLDATVMMSTGLFDASEYQSGGGRPIGVNGYRSSGDAYTMMKGLVGVDVDFDQWKGDAIVADALFGSVMQSGGPNPTWAYGPLQMNLSCLSGRIDLGTGMNVALGNTKDAGVGETQDNENVFRAITPGYASQVVAKDADRIVSPYGRAMVVTNMPITYGTMDVNDVLLVLPGQEPRRLCFALLQDGCAHAMCDADGHWTDGGIKLTPKNINRVEFESSNGGFESGRTHEFKLRAVAYEKRFGTGVYADRKINVLTGEDDLYHRTVVCAWGFPVCEGTASMVEQDTTVYFCTEEAGEGLDNQVVFTWPYNGDPFVPYDELNDACYIVLRQARADIFDSAELADAGKELKVFLVNQERSLLDGVQCTYSYYDAERAQAYAGSKTGYPFVKVNLPADIYKKKANGKTYSPCYVAMYVVDKAKYDSEMAKISYSIEDLGDRTTPLSVCQTIGQPVYTLYFRLDHMYATYADVAEAISNESAVSNIGLGNGSYDVSLDADKGVITSVLTLTNMNKFYTFRNRSYLFDQYVPNNPKLYASDVVLPPVAFFAVNGKQTIDEDYNSHIPEWLALNESFSYQMSQFLYHLKKAKWVVTKDSSAIFEPKLLQSVSVAMSQPSLRLYKADSVSYANMTASDMSELISQVYSQGINDTRWVHECTKTRNPIEWVFPSVICVSSDQVNRVCADHFVDDDHLVTSTFVKPSPVVKMRDYTSGSVMRDNALYAEFFSNINRYAKWYTELDSATRESLRKTFMKEDFDYATLDMGGSPYVVYKASLVAAYDTWANDLMRYKNRDYWFDNWLRSNATTDYTGAYTPWTSPWLSSQFKVANTQKYSKRHRRDSYRDYVANMYFLTSALNEKNFLGHVFTICDRMTFGQSSDLVLYHNGTSDAKVLINVPYYEGFTKEYLNKPLHF